MAQTLTTGPIPNPNPNSSHFTFLQHLTPSQTFITSKKLIMTAKRKMLQKVCTHEDWNPGPFAQQTLMLPTGYKGLAADLLQLPYLSLRHISCAAIV